MITDLSDRYESSTRPVEGAGDNWRMDPVPQTQALIVHHWAGWYGPELTPAASKADEIEQIDRCAADHRDRFGIGPGYTYIAFPSGRAYAVRKWYQHAAHTKGRAPVDAIPDSAYARWPWNWVGRAVAAAGLGNTDDQDDILEAAIDEALWEMRKLGPDRVHPDAPVYVHRSVPTVNARGLPFPQGTACPGQYLASLAQAGQWTWGSEDAQLSCDERVAEAAAVARRTAFEEVADYIEGRCAPIS